MSRVQLVHWNAAVAAERASTISDLGYTVDFRPFTRALLNQMRANPPAAVVIDLSRVPSQGRDVAVSIRIQKGTRCVPLIFVGGDPEKVAATRALLPDAQYVTWAEIGDSLAQAVAHPPDDPIVPSSAMAAYRGTPLVKKLGIKTGDTVVLDGAPDGFEQLLEGLPDDVQVHRAASRERDLTLWFPANRMELERRISEMEPFAERGGLWIVWPKKASGLASDLDQAAVRSTGLSAGLVDFKISSIDATWSGLRFSRRKVD